MAERENTLAFGPFGTVSVWADGCLGCPRASLARLVRGYLRPCRAIVPRQSVLARRALLALRTILAWQSRRSVLAIGAGVADLADLAGMTVMPVLAGVALDARRTRQPILAVPPVLAGVPWVAPRTGMAVCAWRAWDGPANRTVQAVAVSPAQARGAPSPGADVDAVRPVPVQMWQR